MLCVIFSGRAFLSCHFHLIALQSQRNLIIMSLTLFLLIYLCFFVDCNGKCDQETVYATLNSQLRTLAGVALPRYGQMVDWLSLYLNLFTRLER